MHQVEHYDFIVSRTPAPELHEVLLLAVERSDIPEPISQAQFARWIGTSDTLALDVGFLDENDQLVLVRFGQIPYALQQQLGQFDRLMLVWTRDNGVVGEEEISIES